MQIFGRHQLPKLTKEKNSLNSSISILVILIFSEKNNNYFSLIKHAHTLFANKPAGPVDFTIELSQAFKEVITLNLY